MPEILNYFILALQQNIYSESRTETGMNGVIP